MTILLTGFEPFGTHTENPSRDIVRAVGARWAEPEPLETRVLPVQYDAAGTAIVALVDKLRPRAVLMLGLADSAPRPRLERIALNIDDADIADNAGIIRRGVPIRKDGPLALRTRLNIGEMQAQLGENGLTVDLSNHAGAYICNHTYYEALHCTAEDGPPCLFMHVPPTPTLPKEAETHRHSMERITLFLIKAIAPPDRGSL